MNHDSFIHYELLDMGHIVQKLIQNPSHKNE